MPIYEFACLDGHARETYVHVAEDKGAEALICACGHTLAPLGSFGHGIGWFRENHGQWIENLGPSPIFITSHQQHKAEMKKAGVEWVTAGRGRPGQWV